MSDKKPKHKFFFTFGTNHKKDGISLGNSYVLIIADNMVEAREIMFKHHSDKWSFAYLSEDEAGVKVFNLGLFAQYGGE